MDPLRPQGAKDNDLVPAPLMSQGSRREPPPRSNERMVPRNDSVSSRPESNPRTNKADPIAEQAKETPRATNASLTSIPDTVASADTTPQTPENDTPKEEEEVKPGLGPMIKPKKSQKDLAGTLWKAATVASAFKPRPGGAGERLRELQRKGTSDGPDGITSVVPAPPRPVPQPEAPKPTETASKSDVQPPPVPEVKLTAPNSSRPSSLEVSVKETQKKQLEDARKDAETQRVTVSGNDSRYFSALGVDTTLLAEPATEFARWLDHFGWVPGSQMRSQNFDDMRLDIERELNKAQAGGWIARFQEEDERVDGIKRGLDVAIAECDELDNLLTLYSVELSVSNASWDIELMNDVLTNNRRYQTILPT